MKINFVTGNANKANEVSQIFDHADFSNLSASNLSRIDLDLPEFQGDSQYIAKAKVTEAFNQIKAPVVVEDVSLCFNALNGMPGPYIKDFLDKLGNDGLWELISHYPDNSAVAVCTVAFKSSQEHDPIIFVGEIEGHIVPPAGPKKFGWDPIFKPKNHTSTFAEMDPTIKNCISHRTIAFKKLAEYLDKLK